MPAWHARDVAIERGRRAGIPVLLVSPCPEPRGAGLGADSSRRAATPSARGGPPSRSSTCDAPLIPSAPGSTPTRSSACSSRRPASCACSTAPVGPAFSPARPAVCSPPASVAPRRWSQPEEALVCARCATTRPPVCLHCHATRFKNLRAGVTRVREELEALAGEAVVDVSGAPASDGTDPTARVVVGTEAALHRVTETDVVAFLDFDQELLAPRYRASEEAFALLARAARLVGGRRAGRPRARADPGARARGDRRRAARRSEPGVAGRAGAAHRLAVPAVRRDGGGVRCRRGGVDRRHPAHGASLGVEVLGPAKGTWLVRADTPRRALRRGPGRAAVERTRPRRSRSPAHLTRLSVNSISGAVSLQRMAPYAIRVFGDPVLKKRADDVIDIDGRLARLADDMLVTMYDAPGARAWPHPRSVCRSASSCTTSARGRGRS